MLKMLYCLFPSLCPPQLIPFSDQLSFSLQQSPECDNHHYWRGGGLRGGGSRIEMPPCPPPWRFISPRVSALQEDKPVRAERVRGRERERKVEGEWKCQHVTDCCPPLARLTPPRHYPPLASTTHKSFRLAQRNLHTGGLLHG